MHLDKMHTYPCPERVLEKNSTYRACRALNILTTYVRFGSFQSRQDKEKQLDMIFHIIIKKNHVKEKDYTETLLVFQNQAF